MTTFFIGIARVSRHLGVSLALLLGTAGCHTAQFAGPREHAWSAAFAPPPPLRTGRVRLEPLTPDHAALDFDAFMSSREHLHRTLHWGSWPRADMTVEENRRDLERHAREFAAREAYAYAVLVPDGSASVGCIYIDPVKDEPAAAELSYWVTAASVPEDLDRHLLSATLRWIEEDWPFMSVLVTVHEEDGRGVELARGLGLKRVKSLDDEHVAYVWRR